MKYHDTIVLIQLFIIRILITIDTELLENLLKQVLIICVYVLQWVPTSIYIKSKKSIENYQKVDALIALISRFVCTCTRCCSYYNITTGNKLTVSEPILGSAPFSSNNSTISVFSFLMAIIRAGVPPDGYYYNKLNITVHACSNKPQ